MRKLIFGATFLFLAPFGLILLLVVVLFAYQIPKTSSASLEAFGNPGTTVAFAALPTEQNIQSASVTQADGRVPRITAFLQAYGSPLVPYASDIVNAADENGLDYRLLVSIGMQESGLCKTIPANSYNCWGFGIYGKTVTRFDNYKDAIYTISAALAKDYKEKGMVTPNQMMSTYTPPSNGSWANGVNYFMNQLQYAP